MLTREQLLASKLRLAKVDVPELGDHVYVRAMTGRERLAWQAEQDASPVETQRERLAVATLCDENGVKMFTPEEAPVVADIDFMVLCRVFVEAMAVNRLTAGDSAALEKNSEASPSDSTPSASRNG